MKVDLHIHTAYSDGVFTPEKIVETALNEGLECIALTDHDTVEGCFEIDKELFKDPSMRIVAIALKNYFIDNVPIEETICNHKDILDFCLRLKTTRDCFSNLTILNKDGTQDIKALSRTTRYYISNSVGSGVLTKIFGDGSRQNVNSGFTAKIFNEFEEKDDYQINYQFYIQEANKIKNIIVNQQLDLFGNY